MTVATLNEMVTIHVILWRELRFSLSVRMSSCSKICRAIKLPKNIVTSEMRTSKEYRLILCPTIQYFSGLSKSKLHDSSCRIQKVATTFSGKWTDFIVST
jgi:hypothetical protein